MQESRKQLVRKPFQLQTAQTLLALWKSVLQVQTELIFSFKKLPLYSVKDFNMFD